MKRGWVLFSVSLILILSLSIISASWFTDLFDKITGKAQITGQTVAGTCSGTATACSNLSYTICTNQEGCYLTGSTFRDCGGTASSCASFSDSIACQAQAGCTWATTSTCTDSDGAVQIYIKGKVIGSSPSGNYVNKSDFCSYGNEMDDRSCNGPDCQVYELSCTFDDETGNYYAEAENYYCVNGCVDGACIGFADEQYTLEEGQSIYINVDQGNFKNSYYIKINYIANDVVKFDVNTGGEITNSLSEGESQRLIQGATISVHDIVFQDFIGGVKEVTFSLGMSVVASECIQAGYECTSAVRGCGIYDEMNLSCDAGTAVICCTQIPAVYIIEEDFGVDYEKKIIYETDSLEQGINADGVDVASSWFSGFIGGESATYHFEGDLNDDINVVITESDHSLTLAEFNSLVEKIRTEENPEELDYFDAADIGLIGTILVFGEVNNQVDWWWISGNNFVVISGMNEDSLDENDDSAIEFLGAYLNRYPSTLYSNNVTEEYTLEVGGVIYFDDSYIALEYLDSSIADFEFGSPEGNDEFELNEGESYNLKNNWIVTLNEIVYQDYVGGIQQATFSLEAYRTSKPAVSCDNGCVLDNKCYPYNNRKNIEAGTSASMGRTFLGGGYYCAVGGEWVKQTGDGEFCDNNFECSSNICVSNQCVEGNLIQKILAWFRDLFGIGESGEGQADEVGSVLRLFEDAQILWGHDGKSGTQECQEQLNATCVSSVISFRQFQEGGDEVWTEVPSRCNLIYNMEQNLSENGERLNSIVCAKAQTDKQQQILDLFKNAEMYLVRDGKSCSQEAEEAGGTCVSNIISFRQFQEGGDEVWFEGPHSCDTVYDAEFDLTKSGGKRADYCIIAKASNDKQQQILDLFENAQFLWGHDGKSGTQECQEQLDATCVSSVMSYRQFNDGDEVWAEVPQRCDSVYDMETDLSIDGYRLNAIVCAA